VLLPEPVGPVTRRIAVRPLDDLLEEFIRVGQHADVGEVEDHAALVEQTHDDASPWTIGMMTRGRRSPRFWTRILMRPSCGRRFSAMLSRDMILRRLIYRHLGSG